MEIYEKNDCLYALPSPRYEKDYNVLDKTIRENFRKIILVDNININKDNTIEIYIEIMQDDVEEFKKYINNFFEDEVEIEFCLPWSSINCKLSGSIIIKHNCMLNEKYRYIIPKNILYLEDNICPINFSNFKEKISNEELDMFGVNFYKNYYKYIEPFLDLEEKDKEIIINYQDQNDMTITYKKLNELFNQIYLNNLNCDPTSDINSFINSFEIRRYKNGILNLSRLKECFLYDLSKWGFDRNKEYIDNKRVLYCWDDSPGRPGVDYRCTNKEIENLYKKLAPYMMHESMYDRPFNKKEKDFIKNIKGQISKLEQEYDIIADISWWVV